MGKKRKILQVQLNPHFFYNTLNGMMALNRMGEKKKLEKSIMNLAELCRYSTVGEEDTATVEDECMAEKQYLELEKLKYNDRIEYQISVEDSCRDKKIPKLLLQPILENSMVHGLSGREQGITITIRVSLVETEEQGSMMQILVSDDGIGFEQGENWSAPKDSGIAYVEKRAKQFDRDMVFSCTSKFGEGTKTVLLFRENQGVSE